MVKIKVGDIFICTDTMLLVKVDSIDGNNYKASVTPMDSINWHQHEGFFYVPFLARAVRTKEYIPYTEAAQILFTK